MLGRDRLIRNLTEHDFFESTPDAGSRIIITATITGFDPEDFIEHPEWFGDRRAVPAWFEPKEGTILPAPAAGRQLACQIEFAARFDADTLEVETARYFKDADGIDAFDEENPVAVPAKLIRDVGFFLVSASRTWDRMLSFSSELFRRVIRSADGLPAASILEERDRLRTPDVKLEDDGRLSPVITKVNDEMMRLLGKATPLRLRITATDSASVLEAVMPHFQTEERTPIPAKRQGSGLVSLQSLFLLLHFGQKRVEDGEGFFMALEEPELHIPPAVQRRVVARLQALSTQTIVSTHSPLVASYCDAASLIIVRNDEGVLSATPLLSEPLAQAATNAVRRLFQINRVETAAAMMADHVLVPEGRLDFDWLTLLLRVAELDRSDAAPCLFGGRVGIVPTADAKVLETCAVLGRAHPKVCALVDGDAEGIAYADGLDAVASASGASVIIRWPNGWTIEDFIGWIVQADEATIIARLDAELDQPPRNHPTLVVQLKSKDRAAQGLKGDGVAYDIIANALSESTACRVRTRAALQSMADACAGAASARFVVEAGPHGRLPRLVFSP